MYKLNEDVLQYISELTPGRHYTCKMLSARIYKDTGIKVSPVSLSKSYLPRCENIVMVRMTAPALYKVIE